MEYAFPQIPHLDKALARIEAAKGRAFARRNEANPRSVNVFADLFAKTAGGLYFANFVFQGGGILGVAHLGFLYGLESAGIRCAGVAGTSAGAILAVLIAAARKGDIGECISTKLVPILWQMPGKTFIDGPYRIRRVIKSALGRRLTASAEMILPLWSSVKRIKRERGLNPGSAFYDWLAAALARDLNVRTVGELDALLERTAIQLDALFPSNDSSAFPPRKLLKIVATGLPQAAAANAIGIKMIFPDNVNLFSPAYMHHSPALFARASMSIPMFFEPFDLSVEAGTWSKWVAGQFKRTLSKVAIADLALAKSIAFVDGGLLSNFPIDSFLHKKDCGQLSTLPTIGVALVGEPSEQSRAPTGSVRAMAKFFTGILDGMRHVRDRDGKNLANIINSSTELNLSVAIVDVGRHNWLDFQLDPTEMSDLFVRGVVGAEMFLDGLGSDEQWIEASFWMIGTAQ